MFRLSFTVLIRANHILKSFRSRDPQILKHAYVSMWDPYWSSLPRFGLHIISIWLIKYVGTDIFHKTVIGSQSTITSWWT